VPSPRKTAVAIGSAVIAAALAYPPSRRQVVRTARTAIDELMLRTDTPWTARLLLLTSEGRRTQVPRTAVLTGVSLDGELFVVPWSKGPAWLGNVQANPAVVVDDRNKVRRARAEVVDGEVAERVRKAFLEENVPRPARGILGGAGAPLGPGGPVVRLDRS
jgi:deazaflavin-dependent oxidoreductase (nitroreductase family)